MRTASICDTCATYINASCIVYNGDYLSTLDVAPLETLDDILLKINNKYTAQSGDGPPDTEIPSFIGQQYIDTNGFLWIGMATDGPNWALEGALATTTTTTTTTTTSTSTTTTTTTTVTPP